MSSPPVGLGSLPPRHDDRKIFAISQDDVEVNSRSTGRVFLYQIYPKAEGAAAREHHLPVVIGGALASLNGFIYWVGGKVNSAPVDYGYVINIGSSSPAWSIIWCDAPYTLKVERYLHSAVAHQGELYVLGGRKDGGEGRIGATISGQTLLSSTGMWRIIRSLTALSGPVSLASCEEYLVAVGHKHPGELYKKKKVRGQEELPWKKQGREDPLPERNAIVAIGYDVYIIGGKSTNRFITKFTANTEKWEDVPCHAEPRWNFSACAYGGDIIIAGGYKWNPAHHDERIYENTMLCFNPLLQTIRIIPDMTSSRLFQNSMVAV